jgi:carboxypeptidase Taq
MNEAFFGTPLCEAISLGIHESQSRLWENYVGRSRPFWASYFPRLKEHFPDQLADVDQEAFYIAINRVTPSLIRVEADEVTYNLHIMLRFDLERALLNGDLEVADLPAAWNEKMRDYLGITPRTDSEGVLQDIHWSLGALGYFPTYALGNLYGRQIFDAARDQISNLDDRIADGDLKTLREWLREKIHRVGRSISAEELMISVTGRPLSAQPFIDYLETKYGELYQLEPVG